MRPKTSPKRKPEPSDAERNRAALDNLRLTRKVLAGPRQSWYRDREKRSRVTKG